MNQDMQPSASPVQSSANLGGYMCAGCGQWVMWGVAHFCPPRVGYAQPQAIYTNIVPIEVEEKLDQILKELQKLKELLK